MNKEPIIIEPNWPTPANINAFCSTREGGCSEKPYKSFNLGVNCGDNPENVSKNREYLQNTVGLPHQPSWLHQIHGNHVIKLTPEHQPCDADASVSNSANLICTVLTADCLPILLCNQQGSEVAAIHGGWRSLASGIIANTLKQLESKPEDILAWLGPCIHPDAFTVGNDVKEAFMSQNDQASNAFVQTDGHHWQADLSLLATQLLEKLGITAIFRTEYDTSHYPELFYSYRREKTTGRFATGIYFE
jgi:polyphenol oxidase